MACPYQVVVAKSPSDPLSFRFEGGFIDLGTSLTTGVGCRIEAFSTASANQRKIIFGADVQINDYVHISAMEKVVIGDSVLIASHVYISDNSHGCYKGDAYDTPPTVSPKERPYYVAPVNIGNRAWIGEGAIILPGVTIGDGAVIGAHSVVNRNVPVGCIAAGVPARIVKRWDDNAQKWIKVKNNKISTDDNGIGSV